MNKYQEALADLKKQLVVVDYWDGKATSQEPIFEEQTETLQELVDIYPEYLELKKRATPKKINTSAIEEDDNSRAWAKVLGIEGFCPSCDYQVSKKEKYCRMCGQALDWSEDEKNK